MAWAVPTKTRGKVDAAGDLLAAERGSADEINEAYDILARRNGLSRMGFRARARAGVPRPSA